MVFRFTQKTQRKTTNRETERKVTRKKRKALSLKKVSELKKATIKLPRDKVRIEADR